MIAVISSTETFPLHRDLRGLSASPTVKWRQRQMTGMPGKARGRQLAVRARFGLMRLPQDYSCVVA